MALGWIFLNLWKGITEIFKSIFKDLSIFWFLGPIFLFWLVLEVYFSRYKKEQLGWNTALGNGLSVFWILTISIKHLFEDDMKQFEWMRFIALVIIMAYAVFIIFNSFSHKLQEKTSFLIASPTITYYLSGIAILWTFGGLDITWWVLTDLIFLYIIVLVFEVFLKKLVKGKEDSFGSNIGKGSDLGGGGLGGGGDWGGTGGGL